MSDDLQNAATSETPVSPTSQPALERPPLGVLQRTAAAISPWVRGWWTGGRVPGQMPLASRVQRSVAFAAEPGSGPALTNHFTHAIIQRHTAAEQIGRRYRQETRQPAGIPPTQMPLPGVQGSMRVQRAPGEMSLEDLARSYQAERVESPAAADMPIQREFDPGVESTSGAQTTLTDIQDAMRRANQARAGQVPATAGETQVQRAPEAGRSIFSSIDERVRRARERLAAAGESPVEVPAPGQLPPRQMPARPTPPGQSTAPSVQRTPAPQSPSAPSPRASDHPASDPSADVGNSIAAAIRERIREARERMASGTNTPQSAPSPSTPSPSAPTHSAPPSVQRAPELPIQPAPPARSAQPIPPRAPQPPMIGPQPAPPPIQRTPANQEMEGVPDDAPRELPLPPTSETSSAGFSKAAAVRERIQRAREQGGVKPPVSSKLDPNSPDYSKAEAIRQRIEQARIQRQPVEYSTNPEDPNFSAAAQIRERIAANRAQRAAGIDPGAAQESEPPTSSAPTSTAPTSSESPAPPPVQRAVETPAPPAASAPPPIDPTQSIAAQIRNRIQAAREQLQGGQPPAARQEAAGPTPPAASPPSNMPEPPTGSTPPTGRPPDVTPPAMPTTGPTAPTTIGPASAPDVQRTPDDRPAIARELHLKPSGLSGKDLPQAKRVRALTRSQILTPERKTGDFTAGEAPRPGAVPMVPPRVQRTPAESAPSARPATSTTPTDATSSTSTSTPPANEATPAQSDDRDDGSASPLARATGEGPPGGPPPVQRAVEPGAQEVSAPPSASPTIEPRTIEPPAVEPSEREIEPENPASSAAERVQRAPDNRTAPESSTPVSEAPAPPSEAPRTAAPPSAPRAVEPTTPEAPAPERVQRTPATPLSREATEVPGESSESTSAPVPPTVQGATESAGPNLGPVSGLVSGPDRVQRTSDSFPPRKSGAPREPSAATPPQVQHRSESDAPTVQEAQSTSEPPVTPAPPRIQRAAESRDLDDAPAASTPATSTPAETSTSPAVQPAGQPAGVPAPERIQRRADDRAPSESPAPVHEAPAAARPAVQPTQSAPEGVQRAPESSAARNAPTPASEPPVMPEHSTSSSAPTAPRATGTEVTDVEVADGALSDTSAPVQRTPETRPAPTEPAARDMPAAPQVQRSVETPAVDVPERVQRTAETRPEHESSTTSEPSSASPASPPVSSTVSPPRSQGERTADSAPLADVQRTPDARPAGESPSAPDEPPSIITPAPPGTPPVQRVAEMPSQDAPHSIQRTPDTRPEHEPPAPPPTLQRRVDAEQPAAQAPAASPPASIQRKPDDRAARGTPAPISEPPTATTPAASAPTTTPSTETAPAATPSIVQRAIAPTTPDVADAPAPETPAASALERVQRTPETSTPQEISPAPSEPPSMLAPPVTQDPVTQDPVTQESVAQDVDASSAAEHVQRTPDTRPSTQPPPAVPPATLRAKLPPEAAAVQRAAAESDKPSMVAALEERMRQAREGARDSGAAPSAPTGELPRTPLGDTPTIQRAVDPDAPAAPAAPETKTDAPDSAQRKPASRPAASEPSTPRPSPSPPATSSPATSSPAISPPASLRAKLPPEARAVQRAAAESNRPSIVAALEERMRQASLQQKAPGITPGQGESTGGIETPTEISAVQRTAEPLGHWDAPAIAGMEPAVQRTPDAAAPAHDLAPFRPINRYRDPRVLARKAAKAQPSMADLPLSRVEPSAVLPQARLAPLPLVEPRVQRQHAEKETDEGPQTIDLPQNLPQNLPQIGSTARPRVQRSTDTKRERSQTRKAWRVQAPSHSAARSSTVQRSPLPLAKLRTATNGHVIQRDPTTDLDDSFVGSTSSVSSRGKTQTENLGGSELRTRMDELREKEAAKKEPCGCEDESNGSGKDQDLDRLARAILPVVKRMLAIERDRRNPRLLL